MPTLILVRHGRSTANTAGVLAGRTPGVALKSSMLVLEPSAGSGAIATAAAAGGATVDCIE
ncbi:phosphoglycerate mutase, partial [Streptomyces sp. NPDC005969]